MTSSAEATGSQRLDAGKDEDAGHSLDSIAYALIFFFFHPLGFHMFLVELFTTSSPGLGAGCTLAVSSHIYFQRSRNEDDPNLPQGTGPSLERSEFTNASQTFILMQIRTGGRP